MKRMNPDTALALMLGTLFLLGVAFGAVCGGLYFATPVPALQVTVKAPPAPDVIYAEPSGTWVTTAGGCTVYGPIPEGYNPHSWKLRKPQLHGTVTFTDGDCERTVNKVYMPCVTDNTLYAPVERIK